MSVECGLGRVRKIKLIIAFVVLLGYGILSGYDGWINEEYQPGGKKADNQTFNQWAAVACGIGVVVVLVRFAGAMKTRVLADENGIDVNGKVKIRWEDISGADDTKYEKGLVRLRYRQAGQDKEYLIDRYVINHFDEFLDEISRHRPDVLAPEPDDQEPGPSTDAQGGTETRE